MTTDTTIETNPPIVGTVGDGWGYAFTAFSRMPAVLGVGMVLMLVLQLALIPFLPRTAEDDIALGTQAIGFLSGLVQGFLLTPVAIAVHRFVLMGEVAPRYSLNPSDPRFMRFFYFTVILQLVVTIPSVLMMLGPEVGGGAGIALVFAFFVLFVAAIIATLRLLILFPAIAVDAGGADWRAAMADTRGHTWRVFFIVLLAAIPAMLVGGLVQYLLSDGGSSFAITIPAAVLQAVIGVLMLAAFAAIASKLFAAYANRLNG